jgi:hypothetical protein
METFIYVDDFSGNSDSEKIQKAIDFAAVKGNPKTVILSDRDYVTTKSIIIKKGVNLKGAYGSRLVIYGNFRVLELQQNASINDLYIAIDDAAFNSDVIYLNGKYKYYNSWNRSEINNINIVNWASVKGNGISMYSNGPGHEISFLKVSNVKIANMGSAINLTAVKPSSGFSYINANSFDNVVIDACTNGIILKSGNTIPNEVSGNTFTNLQIQLASYTKLVFNVTGQYNVFEGMIWDTQVLSTTTPIINLLAASSNSKLDLGGNLNSNHISDKGKDNVIR